MRSHVRLLVAIAATSCVWIMIPDGIGLGADEPVPFSPRSGEPRGLPGSRAVAWSQPPDLNGYKVSSEIIGEFALESRIIDDFQLPSSTTITGVSFWGGYYNWNGEEPDPRFNLRLYADQTCFPGDVQANYLHLDPERTFVGYDGFGFPTYKYDAQTSFPVLANTIYWCMFQADDHVFPPQWGVQQALEEQQCPSMYCMIFDLCYWTETSQYVGEPWDASFELTVPDEPTRVERTTFGKIRATFR